MHQKEPSCLQKVAIVCRSWVEEWDEALLFYASIPLHTLLLLRFCSVFAFSLPLVLSLPLGGFEPPSSRLKNRSSDHSTLDRSTILTAPFQCKVCSHLSGRHKKVWYQFISFPLNAGCCGGGQQGSEPCWCQLSGRRNNSSKFRSIKFQCPRRGFLPGNSLGQRTSGTGFSFRNCKLVCKVRKVYRDTRRRHGPSNWGTSLKHSQVWTCKFNSYSEDAISRQFGLSNRLFYRNRTIYRYSITGFRYRTL
jgi:hypothetical protein